MEILSGIKLKPFEYEWWNDFIEVTAGLTKTSVFKDCLSKEETNLYRTYVLDIIRELNALRTNKFGYRVYLEGKILNNDEMNFIYDSPPFIGESLESWVVRVFGDKKFGIIINKGEKFNLELSQDIALKTEDLFRRVGYPREGINFTLFIGNYDKTPLGIHQDKKGENVMHFHLGPGSKTMYTWDKEEYLHLAGDKKQNNHDVEILLPHATEFKFDEGDVYFMPQGEYHIGAQEGLSVAITLWQYNHTKEKLIAKLQSLLYQEYTKPNDDLLNADRNSLDDTSCLDDVLSTVEIPEDFTNLSFKALLRETYRDLRYSIHSNAGYRTSPIPTKDFLLSQDDVLQSQKPYQILYKESISGTKLHVFIRGIKIELNNFSCVKNLIDEINTWEKFTVKDLIGKLEDQWPLNIKTYLIDLFYTNHGILKVN